MSSRYEVTFDPAAERDFIEIHDYVRSRAGQEVARNHLRRLHDFCMALDEFPERGTRRDDLRPGIRTVGFEHRATVVQVDRRERQVMILAVAHGGRNFEDEFRR